MPSSFSTQISMPGLGESGGSEPAPLTAGWFEEVGQPLHQGDILFDFPLPGIDFQSETQRLRLVRAVQTVIVVTQTCDIPKTPQTELLLASVYEFSEFRTFNDRYKSSAFRKTLEEGTSIAEFALPPPPDTNEFLVASFRKLHVVPKAYVLSSLPERMARLRSPYKEYFAQAYARFMMRVGLPMTLSIV